MSDDDSKFSVATALAQAIGGVAQIGAAMINRRTTERQHQVKVHADLIEPRRKIYDAVRILFDRMDDTFHGVPLTSQDISNYSGAIHDKEFLFPDDLCAYLDHVFVQAQNLRRVNDWLRDFGAEAPEFHEYFEAKESLIAWTIQQYDDGALKLRFAPYLTLV